VRPESDRLSELPDETAYCPKCHPIYIALTMSSDSVIVWQCLDRRN
jgi:hypothetical protein